MLDSNLLLLYLIGSFERARVEAFKRTAQFSVAEFDALVSLVSTFKTILTTPHILTEVNSLANSLPDHLKSSWCNHFALQIRQLVEVFDSAIEIVQESSYNPFGLADAAIQKAAKDTLILTEDYRLSGYLRAKGIDALNFQELFH